MGLPSGEVDLHEVLAWAQEQSPFLRSASARLLLMDLCINAWRHDRNRQGAEPGEVVQSATSLHSIQRRTGMSDKTVRRAMAELQEEGFLIADLKQGFGKNRIVIFWTEGADERRTDYRAGIRPLPRGFKREVETPSVADSGPHEAVVINFPIRSV